ncbi:MAG TPA: hypothetical protein VIL63_14010, partial [Terriglobales bacterium]
MDGSTQAQFSEVTAPTEVPNDRIIEAQTNDPSAQTPFVIYDSGTPRWIANAIYASAEATLDIFSGRPVEEAFADLRERTRTVAHRLHDADASLVWMTYLALFLTREGDDTPSLPDRLNMVRWMTQRPPETAWAVLREYVLKNVDTLSGWAASHVRIFSERDQIFRGDDGLYYQRGEDGTLYQVIGAKTLRETRLDFISDQLLRNHGNLRQPLELFSWFATSYDF